MGITNISVIGMIKDKKHRTKGLILDSGEFLDLKNENKNENENDKYNEAMLEVDEKLEMLRLVTAIQDETHRFAISYTKKLSKKRNIKYSLETIKGVGQAKRKILLQEFGSIRAISDATVDNLEKIKGINKELAEEIYNHFRSK